MVELRLGHLIYAFIATINYIVGCGSAHADQIIMSEVENQPLAGESHLSVSLVILFNSINTKSF